VIARASAQAPWPAVASLAAVSLFMLVAAALYWPVPEAAFRSDNSPVSWLSSAQLWAIALLSLRLAADGSLPRSLGTWLSIAMVVLAFDEQFMLHEQWKYGCIQWLEACRYHWVTEIPTALVGVVGTATAVWLHRALDSRNARALIWSALAVGGLAIVVDLFQWPAFLTPAEEGLEVIAESLFAGALLVAPRTRDQVHSP